MGAAVLRCLSCRKAFENAIALEAHQPLCPGPDLAGDSPHYRIVVPSGQGVHCWACGRFRRAVWLEPDFCCATCKAVLITASKLN